MLVAKNDEDVWVSCCSSLPESLDRSSPPPFRRENRATRELPERVLKTKNFLALFRTFLQFSPAGCFRLTGARDRYLHSSERVVTLPYAAPVPAGRGRAAVVVQGLLARLFYCRTVLETRPSTTPVPKLAPDVHSSLSGGGSFRAWLEAYSLFGTYPEAKAGRAKAAPGPREEPCVS